MNDKACAPSSVAVAARPPCGSHATFAACPPTRPGSPARLEGRVRTVTRPGKDGGPPFGCNYGSHSRLMQARRHPENRDRSAWLRSRHKAGHPQSRTGRPLPPGRPLEEAADPAGRSRREARCPSRGDRPRRAGNRVRRRRPRSRLRPLRRGPWSRTPTDAAGRYPWRPTAWPSGRRRPGRARCRAAPRR